MTRIILFSLLTALAGCVMSPLPEPAAVPEAPLRGFNLLGFFDAGWTGQGFQEEDFRLIRELGFNFVRLPLDYRNYTVEGDWRAFREDRLQELDRAVAWAEKYGLHVTLNLHRAPGYCVNPADLLPEEERDLWTDSTAQQVFTEHWRMLAVRYRNKPAALLSFNLVNEPSGVDEEIYRTVMGRAAEAVHKITPDRIIYLDGLDYSRKLLKPFSNPKIRQSLHLYDPMTLTHYQAGWIPGSDTWEEPRWPVLPLSRYLYGPGKPEFQSELTVRGNFPAGTVVTLRLHQVSVASTLEIVPGSGEKFLRDFICTDTPDQDFTQVVSSEWGYQNISGKEYSLTLTEDCTEVVFRNTGGDWLTFRQITLGDRTLIPGLDWGTRQKPVSLDAQGAVWDLQGLPLDTFADLRDTLDQARRDGIPLMVQEFGVFNRTPHGVTLGYLKDLTALLKEYGLGFALWNLEGSFGLLNSGRSDMTYEPFQGRLLDRAMLDLLR